MNTSEGATMKIEFDPTYDARENVCQPDNDAMFAASGRRFVLPLTGVVEMVTDHPVKTDQKAARFILDERHGFQPGFAIFLDLDALVPEPECDSAPCDCTPSPAQLSIAPPLEVEGAAPGAAPGTAPAAER